MYWRQSGERCDLVALVDGAGLDDRAVAAAMLEDVRVKEAL